MRMPQHPILARLATQQHKNRTHKHIMKHRTRQIMPVTTQRGRADIMRHGGLTSQPAGPGRCARGRALAEVAVGEGTCRAGSVDGCHAWHRTMSHHHSASHILARAQQHWSATAASLHSQHTTRLPGPWPARSPPCPTPRHPDSCHNSSLSCGRRSAGTATPTTNRRATRQASRRCCGWE